MKHCMTEERLTSLALLLEEVVNMFAHMHTRRLEMDNNYITKLVDSLIYHSCHLFLNKVCSAIICISSCRLLIPCKDYFRTLILFSMLNACLIHAPCTCKF